MRVDELEGGSSEIGKAWRVEETIQMRQSIELALGIGIDRAQYPKPGQLAGQEKGRCWSRRGSGLQDRESVRRGDAADDTWIDDGDRRCSTGSARQTERQTVLGWNYG